MEKKKIKNISSKIIVIIIIIIGIIIYRKYDYNFYSKGIETPGKTTFLRDNQEKTSKTRSYKIVNKDYTDAMFYKTINVEKNTPYKVTCKIKTKDIEQFNGDSTAGAQIVLQGTEEHSEIIKDSNDWTNLEFYFNSKDNTEAIIGFRLGGNDKKAKGTAWFSDLKIEKGYIEENSNWKFGCFIFDNIDVELENGIKINESVTSEELTDMIQIIKNFQYSCNSLSKGKMEASCRIIEVTDPITTLTYDKENGYYVSENDIYNYIKDYTNENEFDHIFICIKLPDEKSLTSNNVTNWIGLGNMEYCGKGFSDIRILEESEKSRNYSSSNKFQEEVFIHEFLHTLERNSKEYGYEVPALHDYISYGYTDSTFTGLKNWYEDYMNGEVKHLGKTCGLSEEIYNYKPVSSENFQYLAELDYLEEPDNLIETGQSIVKRIKDLFNKTELNVEKEGVSE